MLMGDVVRKLSPDRAFEAEQTSLRTMMGNLVGCARLSLTELLALSNFLPFHDLMEGETKVTSSSMLQYITIVMHQLNDFKF